MSGEIRDTDWQGKRAVVTGAGSGIGKAVTFGLIARGCHVVALDVEESALASLHTAPEINQAHLTTMVVDVSDWSQIHSVADQIIADDGAPQYLVPNAGINPPTASQADIDEGFWDRVLDINLKGVFACNHAFLPAMATAGTGSVVNLASVSGLTGWGGSAAYCASKGGVIALTKALAAEYGPGGIRVNCVCPGSVRTPMVLNNLERFSDAEARLEETGRLHLLGRVAEPSEIADTILYLLSAQASFITGSAVVVDGGFTAV